MTVPVIFTLCLFVSTFVTVTNKQRCRFWATICKTVRPMLSDRCLSVCLSCLPVTLVYCGQNGWMDQDETWHAGRPRPWPHCVRWGPAPPSPKGHRSSQFLAHICCGQMAGWIKMPLSRRVGLDPGDIVLDGDPASPPRKGGRAPQFSVHVYCGQTAGWIKMPLVNGVGLGPGHIVLDGNPASPPP